MPHVSTYKIKCNYIYKKFQPFDPNPAYCQSQVTQIFFLLEAVSQNF